MTRHQLKKCSSCKIYTLSNLCTNCNNPTFDPHPPKFSLEDKYIRYRIQGKYLNE
ncbi:MAG: ribosome biogenesis protein [Thaumarchaeota archaeon]|nr:MAG: ribosome biogenesis protein [Nitrososphaerota archaeon]TLX86853.1 MAG: ribosome biogenesis protein [Nitrososphaerota archaeon]TLX90669.1 MAG: ribosome biogenesis protein [Nitrososphaerota archaeon]